MRDWQERLGPKGFTIIGVHTPEFWWERPEASVRKAVEQFQINYHVVIDDNYINWNRWKRLGLWAWPTSFVIDKKGFVRLRHIGPVNANLVNEKIEKLIKDLLRE